MNTEYKHDNQSEMEQLPVDSQSLVKDFRFYLHYHLGRFFGCNPIYYYEALSFTVRDRIMHNWCKTWKRHSQPGTRKAFYMSLEFLIGRAMGNHLLNLDLKDATGKAMQELSLNLEDVMTEEHDAGLGNGGLGRLAACFMDSCATLKLPVLGYGIRYEYGMFKQKIINGYQIEEPDHWLRDGNPWELERPEYTQTIQFGGHTEEYHDANGNKRYRWVNTVDVLAIPYDMPISGYRNNTINTLRLWSASATSEFCLEDFNAGDYAEAVEAKNDAEHITMVLYPNDASENGKKLRLRQQYFLASASLKDAIRLWEESGNSDYKNFARDNVFQMNDTHPTIAVAELMRILTDVKGLEWNDAWRITTECMAYTNHTLLPEALEKWSVSMFGELLPRLLDIIYKINSHFIEQVAQRWPGDFDRLARMSIIEEGHEKHVRMAYLAVVASFSVNGVAELHSKLLCKGLFHDFFELWPEKFNNKTNGVTPRRWIAYANPALTTLVSEYIGDDWIADLSKIEKLSQYVMPEYQDFHQEWDQVKQQNKQQLVGMVKERCGVEFDVNSMFDVQVKRIHEYKRQLLNVLHVIHLYNRIKQGDVDNWTNRCVLIGGKAAPGYHLAKSIIKLVNNVAKVVNNDPDVGNRLKLAFLPNYNVSSMEVICAATDLSEQISTAGKEASGTGNMKFMMNGAITIGTYDGANIEILEAAGQENFFLFGLHTEEIDERRADYHPHQLVNDDKDLKAVMDLLQHGHFNASEANIFDDIIASLLNPHDPWMTLADFRSYIDCQDKVAAAYRDRDRWIRMSIMNTATSGRFSTDRTMHEYNEGIWKLTAAAE